MKSTNLKEVCKVIMGQAPSGSTYNERSEGLPLIAGAGDFGNLTPNPKRHTTAATKKSQENDIILCIRATIGDLNWSDKSYCLGRGVAGLRPKHRELNLNFLWHWLKANKPSLAKKAKGSTFKQVGREDIESLKIPLPPLPEQKRIAAILDKADAIRSKRQQAIKLADEFLRSVFLDMFGDPVTNPKGWEKLPFCQIGYLARGKSKHRPRNDPKLLGGKYPLIQTGDIAKANHFIKKYTQTYSELGLQQSKLWESKTLCITIAANIADTAILTFEACFPDSVVGFIPNEKVRTEYIHMWLTFYQKILQEKAPESAQKNINLEILSKLNIPIPSLRYQEKFINMFYSCEKLKNKMEKFHKETNNNFFALTQQAFRGEL